MPGVTVAGGAESQLEDIGSRGLSGGGTATQHSRSGGGTLVLRAGLSRRSGNAPIQPSTITAVNRYPAPEPVTVRGARGLSCINPVGTRSSQDEGLPSGHPTPGPELLCSPQL